MKLVTSILSIGLLAWTCSAQDFGLDTVGLCFVNDDCQGELAIQGEVTVADCMCADGQCVGVEEDLSRRMLRESDTGPGMFAMEGVESRALREQGSRGLQLRKWLCWAQRVLRIIKRLPLPGRPKRFLKIVCWIVNVCKALTRRNLQQGTETCEEHELETPCEGEFFGEPHIKQLVGGWFDYHGECDLVFSHAPDFDDGLGLDIHARTKIRYDYSYIESAAIKIGDDILEVSSYGEYMFNGISAADLTTVTMAGKYSIAYVNHEDDGKVHMWEIMLDGDNSIVVGSMKDLVFIKFITGEGFYGPEMQSWFKNSTGLMGSLQSSKMLARNFSVMEEPNAMGQEWQVRDSDPQLFQVQDRAPQYPEKCILPAPVAAEERRRLVEMVPREDAETACAHWPEAEKDGCIFDVMATGDLDIAQDPIF